MVPTRQRLLTSLCEIISFCSYLVYSCNLCVCCCFVLGLLSANHGLLLTAFLCLPLVGLCLGFIDLMRPRWKGKGSEAKALADPMSKIVSQLQSTLMQSDSHGLLSGCSVLLEVETEQTELLNRACFGRPIITAQKDKQWCQLGLEEAFYLCYYLKCLKIVGEDECTKNDEEIWNYMKSKRETFPTMFKAYSYLRMRNWVVRSGSQYGVEFVAYRHHPALVHSEYAVLVFSVGGGNANCRLRVWSDFQCTLRLCGSVAKTLLVLHVDKNGVADVSLSCLESYSVEERTITRWSAEQSREDKDKTVAENGTKKE